MDKPFKQKLLDHAAEERRRIEGRYPGIAYPAEGPLLPVAHQVLDDFKATSGFVEPEPEGEVIGRFGLGFDATPILVAIITWILKSVLDEFKQRRQRVKEAKEALQQLSGAELREIREQVVEFGRRVGDHEVLTPEVTAKLADSIERVVSRNPELLLGRGKRGGRPDES